MAIFHEGDMWDVFGKTDLWLFTGNSFETKDGRLAMGKGLARAVRDRFPGIDREFGRRILPLSLNGVVFTSDGALIMRDEQLIGMFQVKFHFRDKAQLSLIGYSCCKLQQYISIWRWKRIDLNMPGVGEGTLPRNQVLPIVSELPDSVHIWEKHE